MIYAVTIPPMDRTLGALGNILTLAEAQCVARKINPLALTGFRLFPDMLPFTKQVQLACDFAARAAARLSASDVPSFPDVETTFPELLTRIATARAYMASVDQARFAGAATRDITLKMRGADVTMSGLDYLTLYSLPQFYFHATTAYNILRHNGIEIGKADFMGA
ncbi:MAG: DUF1993 domain-containing protein [Paracoccaceae bacterium]